MPDGGRRRPEALGEQEMNDVRSRLEAILGAAEIGTWIWDAGCNRVIADPNLACLFGISPEHAAGGPIEHYLRVINQSACAWPSNRPTSAPGTSIPLPLPSPPQNGKSI